MASKEKEHNARKVIARWWYDVNVPFNSARSYYYQPMIDAITSMGPGFKGPSYHDLKGPFLKGVVHDIHKYLFKIKADWKLYGCSIIADGWSNRRNVPIVNFLAYSPRGTIFLKSVDTSGLRKDKETLLEMCDEVAKEMGQENIVQFVSDNESAFKTAGFTTKVESSHGKSKVGKEITAIILQDKDFWPRREHIVKVSEPLMRVLRLADNEEKPAIGYLYEAMDKAKEAIKTRNLSKTRDALDLISLDNIDLLNEWICEEPSLLNGDDISWETIEAPLSTLTLEDEETCFDEENELGGNDQLLECLVDEFPYIPPQD
ncbi:uncharacterized protein [Populus alba]|uniref:uncharacterized protein n=1 Tax=Populus alba TaxID=43335 RepID=UPI003CC78852